MTITKGKIVKHAILPGFLPRIGAIFSSGFVHIAYFMAVIYQNVRLLPPEHPYLNPQNMGRYGIRHVVAEAANNLVFSRKNIDQIIVFFTILAGLILLVMQFVLLIVALMNQPAMAIGLTPFADWFQNPSPAGYSLGPGQDLAFILLDRVFGLQGIYNSCISNLISVCVDVRGDPLPDYGGYPSPMHSALHQLLRFYSLGIAFIGVFVLLYFVTTIIGETVTSGTPFGQRYNKAWVPVRIILFFALIVPLNIGQDSKGVDKKNQGLNAAQLITFHTAKWGSNMASNTWGRFNDVLTGSYLGEVGNLIATPNMPEIGSLNQFFFVAKMCQIAEGSVQRKPIRAYLIREKKDDAGPNYMDFEPTDLQTALDFSRKGNITIRFGELDPAIAAGGSEPSEYSNQKGYVFPWCGEIKIQPSDIAEPGSLGIQEEYYELVWSMWFDGLNAAYGDCVLRHISPIEQEGLTCASINPADNYYPDQEFLNLQKDYFNDLIATLGTNINTQIAAGNWTVPNELLEKGWAGAAIWYNRIAQMNGAVTTALLNIPRPSQYPFVMEEIHAQQKQASETLNGAEKFNPSLPNGKLADLPRKGDQYIAAALYAGYKIWEEDSVFSGPDMKKTDNIIIDTINTIFGTSGIYDMRNNPTTHPLAQLSSLGKAMIEAAVRNALIAGASVVGTGIADLFKMQTGKAMAQIGSSMFITFVQVTIVMGVLLYYVLPFLPFIYFIFAVSGWIKSIFEAVVAMPLWALAHIRIDGEGLPGKDASAGYYLLLEILIRPTLIVFGLLASISIFAALVNVLNHTFDIVVGNVAGFNKEREALSASPNRMAFYRSSVDEFFFTVIYVVIVYMIAQSIFKLIDQIPNNILRWIGITVSTFQEGAGDPAGDLSSQVYKGGSLTVNQAAGSVKGNLALLTS